MRVGGICMNLVFSAAFNLNGEILVISIFDLYERPPLGSVKPEPRGKDHQDADFVDKIEEPIRSCGPTYTAFYPSHTFRFAALNIKPRDASNQPFESECQLFIPDLCSTCGLRLL